MGRQHPPHPLYYERFLEPESRERFEAHWSGVVPRFAVLHDRPEGEYADYKHPNYKGRERYTRELADLLIEAER